MNNSSPVYLTEEGIAKLQQELEELVQVRRPALAERLRKAIQQGDLSENADYISAKEEQGFLEGRIQQLEAMLRNAELIQPEGTTDEVRMGSHVTVEEEGFGEPELFYLVGPAEADPSAGKISYESPMGRAMVGCKVGDTFKVDAPAGEIKFKVVAIG